MEVEAKRIGKLGEKFAYEYYKNKLKNVEWLNQDFELHNPYDLIGFDKERNYKVFIEVKTTIWKGKKWFNFSKSEYGWARKKGRKYIIAHIYIDEKEKKQKFMVTEFVDPTGESKLTNSLCGTPSSICDDYCLHFAIIFYYSLFFFVLYTFAY
ncbi:hypothetical protein MtrunA17_Chr4g0042681 [Medicago truncatula]|uniref:Protein NO VEIN C-terminal domain-containing protein n=1 Tax=Medicago truncatula TaxID=3880 RepID=A0A396I8R3_MEDTR|nr:hypothetical protein MtrunA17_Chr4g0042681 [Medicago truncatula]